MKTHNGRADTAAAVGAPIGDLFSDLPRFFTANIAAQIFQNRLIDQFRIAEGASYALAVGLAIAAMQLTGTLHPPADADPIVVLLAGAGWPFLLTPILTGTLAIVVTAIAYHRWVSKRSYPHR